MALSWWQRIGCTLEPKRYREYWFFFFLELRLWCFCTKQIESRDIMLCIWEKSQPLFLEHRGGWFFASAIIWSKKQRSLSWGWALKLCNQICEKYQKWDFASLSHFSLNLVLDLMHLFLHPHDIPNILKKSCLVLQRNTHFISLIIFHSHIECLRNWNHRARYLVRFTAVKSSGRFLGVPEVLGWRNSTYKDYRGSGFWDHQGRKASGVLAEVA